MRTAPQRQPSEISDAGLFQVRKGTEADIGAVASLHAASATALYTPVSREFARQVAAPAAARNLVNSALTDEASTLLVVEQNGEVVGFALATQGKLVSMGVAEHAQSQGFGTLLLRNMAATHGQFQIQVPGQGVRGFFLKATGGFGIETGMCRFEVGGQGFAGYTRHTGCKFQMPAA